MQSRWPWSSLHDLGRLWRRTNSLDFLFVAINSFSFHVFAFSPSIRCLHQCKLQTKSVSWFHINVLNDTFNDDTIQNIDNSTELIETLIDDDKEDIKDYHDDDQQDEDDYQQDTVVNI